MTDQNLSDDWDESDFQKLWQQDDTEYVIDFDGRSRRTTTISAIAYFATLDPEAEIVEENTVTS